MKGTMVRRLLLGAAAAVAGMAAAAAGPAGAAAAAVLGPGPAAAQAAVRASTPVSRHVVIVGISGLRWTDISASATPALWRVAGRGSVGSLVDYAVLPHTCPADGWLTLNAGNRAQVPHTESAPCPAMPAVTVTGTGTGAHAAPARVPAMPSLVSYNKRFHNSPHWGLLASAAGAGGCATAAGPGAALALAGRSGTVGSYLPDASALDRQVLARCPLTVADLGSLPGGASRSAVLRHDDAELAAIEADLPAGATLMVTAPGSGTVPPHLQATMVSGPAYRGGVLDATSTRQSGMVVLTDLTPTVLGWRGQPVPIGVVGAKITRAERGSLTATARGLVGQDTAAQVWTRTHTIFFWSYALADVAAFAGVGLIFWGGRPERRRRRATLWRAAGAFAVAVPAASFLANLVPWWLLPHSAIWQYGMTLAWTAVIGAVALAGPWRRDPYGPPGFVATLTVLIVGIDVMTGSRLQMGSPFGLSVLEAGRFYGIGGEAVGLYAICGVIAIAWIGNTLLRRSRVFSQDRPPAAEAGRPGEASGPGLPPGRGRALLAAGVLAVFVVLACGWPQFGGKVGGTIAIVPCFLLMFMAMAGIRITARRIVLILGSGLALFLVFALVNYFVPATGPSDIGAFAGNLLHGRAGGVLTRKFTSMIGSLSVNSYSPVVPLVVLAAGIMLVKPSWFAVKALPRGYAAEPLFRMTLAMMWLVAVLGWFADDSGIIVPASALPLALPMAIALLAGVPPAADGPAEYGPAVTGPSVVGRTR